MEGNPTTLFSRVFSNIVSSSALWLPMTMVTPNKFPRGIRVLKETKSEFAIVEMKCDNRFIVLLGHFPKACVT